MAKELKIWNGRGYCCVKPDDPLFANRRPNLSVKGYVAAYSRADARRVIEEYTGRNPGDTELRDYWQEGSWGNKMSGITPERGLWVSIEDGAPVRVI